MSLTSPPPLAVPALCNDDTRAARGLILGIAGFVGSGWGSSMPEQSSLPTEDNPYGIGKAR